MDASEIAEGKCYLASTGFIRRVLKVMPDGRILYDTRVSRRSQTTWRAGGILDRGTFAATVEREISCDWTAE
jgi:hypothetical protein